MRGMSQPLDEQGARSMTSEGRAIVIIVASMMVFAWAKQALIGDARWWNLVMAGVLLVLLVLYLRDAGRHR